MEKTTEQNIALAAAEPAYSDRHTKAIELHEGIKADVRIVAHGLSDIGKKLKQMRDDKLYIELGHASFADYGRAMLGLEQRQLYSYIQIYEVYGPHFIDEHAELGITKLLLLTNIPAPERDGFVEENGVESLTVRELREMTEKYNKAAEQLVILGEEKEDKSTELEHIAEEKPKLKRRAGTLPIVIAEANKSLNDERARYRETEETLARQLKEAENRPIDIAVQEPNEEVLQAIRSEEAEKAKAAAAEAVKSSLMSIENEKAEALARAAELEKRLSMAANNELVQLNVIFEQMQELADKAGHCIARVGGEDEEQGKKLYTAALSIIDSLKEKI
ncbi:MAG: DUF3102 domain-containing protein [Hydrogenoanaerobacterium sp.]